MMHHQGYFRLFEVGLRQFEKTYIIDSKKVKKGRKVWWKMALSCIIGNVGSYVFETQLILGAKSEVLILILTIFHKCVSAVQVLSFVNMKY